MFSANPNNRASLLSGLRTGGVPPKTAAPNAAGFEQQMQLPPQQFQSRGFMTAAVDGPNSSFAQQQQQLNPFQLQAMQLEMMKIQAMQAQAQQYQELVRQQQAQQAQQQATQHQRRTSYQPPATAGPGANFDLRSATLNAQMRRSQAEQLNAQQASPYEQMPMTAALGGKFGTRSASGPATASNPAAPPTPSHASTTTVISGGTSLGNPTSNAQPPSTPSKSDAVSSWRRGGANKSALNALRDRVASSPTVKVTSPPKETNTTPLGLKSTNATDGASKRPKPLSFSLAAQQPMIPAVLIETSEGDEDVDDNSSNSDSSQSHSDGSGSHKSSPTTSNELLSDGGVNLMQPPLSPRQEATKKLYEGLGVGRPRSRNSDSGEPLAVANPVNMAPPQTAALFPSHGHPMGHNAFPHTPLPLPPMPNTASLSGPNYAQHRLDRSVGAPKRQPRGPPSGADELGPMNFASRSPRLPITVGTTLQVAVEAY